MHLTDFRTLGHSGLVVSPLALGTMTFGTPAWGATDATSQTIFTTYVEAGGNFIDTADVYAGGRSEELLGGYIASRSLRDQLVVATKFTFNTQPGNPNAGGNGRKHIHRALEGSLRRLKTDYIDLYWLHAWDRVTPVEEVLQTLGDLIRVGKIRYVGFSNVPAWYLAKAATLSAVHSIPGPVALQAEYSLVERSLEREHRYAAREFGLGLVAWSPLAGGLLTGKYSRDWVNGKDGGRLTKPNPFGDTKFTDRNWHVVDILRTVSAQVNRSLSQVALAWVLAQPGTTSVLLGASRPEQLIDNLQALTVEFTAAQLRALDEASALEVVHPYMIQTAAVNRGIFGGNAIQGWLSSAW